jgi:mannose-6-phosphate isomerase-like protein (cupin superfamily)
MGGGMSGVITHHFGGGVYAKETRIPANSWLVQHAHKFDHLSILAEGSVELIIDGESQLINAPACLTIKANKHHGVRSVTDVIWYCVHATDCADENKIDEVLIAPVDMSAVENISRALTKEH